MRLDFLSWWVVLLWVRGEDFLDVVRERCVRSEWPSCGLVGNGAGLGMDVGGRGGGGASAGGGGVSAGGGRGEGLG